MPHSRVYDVTRRLIRMGVALLAKKNPDSFSPLAPEDLILKLKKDHDRHIDELKVRLERISFFSDFDPVWNISNPKEALDITRGLIREAKQKVYIGI